MWRIFITSGITRARATGCSFLQSAKTQSVKARCSVANGLGGSSNTTHAKPHEFFDHTRSLGQPGEHDAPRGSDLSAHHPDGPGDVPHNLLPQRRGRVERLDAVWGAMLG